MSDIDHGHLNPEGVPPHNSPDSYRGVALNVIRDPEIGVVIAFDGNGTVLYIDRGLTHNRVDCKVPYTAQGILDAINGGVDE